MEKDIAVLDSHIHIIDILSAQGYYATPELGRQVTAALRARPVPGAFLFGPPGAGKSALPQALAKGLGRRLVFFQVFPGLREEDLLVKIIPDAASPSGVRAEEGPVTEAARLSRRHQVVLVLDEWDKSRPSADSFLLDFLQSGRLRFGGVRLQAKLSSLAVFVTSNEERELAEPLLRRLPRIDIPLLPLPIVARALGATHPDHPYLGAALKLYRRACAANLRKPATIQELRQLLDAITVLGPSADWDELVYQFVTKSPDDHNALASLPSDGNDGEDRALRARLDPEDYDAEEKEEEEEGETQPSLPRLPRPAGRLSPRREPPLLEEAGAVVRHTPTVYSGLVTPRLDKLTDDPAVFGDVRVVQERATALLVKREPYPLSQEGLWAARQELAKTEGEVAFQGPVDPARTLAALTGQAVITSACLSEVVGYLPTGYGQIDWRIDMVDGTMSIIAPTTTFSSYGFLVEFFKLLFPRCGQSRSGPGQELIELLPGISARLEVARKGHTEASVADAVVVQACLGLPTDPDDWSQPILRELQFGQRLFICDEPLDMSWGTLLREPNSKNSWRRESREFIAQTWEEAESQAWAWLHSQVKKLKEALERRQKALQGA